MDRERQIEKDQDTNIQMYIFQKEWKNINLHLKTLSATSKNIFFFLNIKKALGINSFKAQLEMDQL